MPRKIYDIKPPKTVVRKKISKVSVEPVVEKPEILINTKARKRHNNIPKEARPAWVPISIIILVVIFVAGVYLFFKLPRVEVAIWPKVDLLSYQQTITANKLTESIDLLEQVIPAQYFEASKINDQDFPATGSASNEGKASGLITVYNKCDPVTPVTLSKGAHFLSDSGKSFSYLQKIVIPAATKKLGKTTPGSVQLTVTADDSGSEYNIAPAAFSIPKLNGTIYYSCIYATSSEDMEGGYTGKVKKVTDDDIQEAKDVLVKQTSSDAMDMLKQQITSDYILLDNAVLTSVVSASSNTKAGSIVDNFNYQVEVKATALAFKKSDIEQFARNYIVSQIPEGKIILEKDFKVDYSTNIVDVSGGKMTINIDFSSGVYEDVDRNSLSLSFMGQNEDQIAKTIESSLGQDATKSEIKFWPFWVKTAPNNQKVINIELKF